MAQTETMVREFFHEGIFPAKELEENDRKFREAEGWKRTSLKRKRRIYFFPLSFETISIMTYRRHS